MLIKFSGCCSAEHSVELLGSHYTRNWLAAGFPSNITPNVINEQSWGFPCEIFIPQNTTIKYDDALHEFHPHHTHTNIRWQIANER